MKALCFVLDYDRKIPQGIKATSMVLFYVYGEDSQKYGIV